MNSENEYSKITTIARTVGSVGRPELEQGPQQQFHNIQRPCIHCG